MRAGSQALEPFSVAFQLLAGTEYELAHIWDASSSCRVNLLSHYADSFFLLSISTTFLKENVALCNLLICSGECLILYKLLVEKQNESQIF